MKSDDVISALAALAHEHRLAVFRLLVERGDEGMAAGAIARQLGLPNSSLSFHLAQLQQADLLKARRDGRSLIYAANYRLMAELLGFLTDNCCEGASCDVVTHDGYASKGSIADV